MSPAGRQEQVAVHICAEIPVLTSTRMGETHSVKPDEGEKNETMELDFFEVYSSRHSVEALW